MTERGAAARLIRLRRPAVLAPVTGPFVPEGDVAAAVEARWAALRAANPAHFDGRLLNVLGVRRNGHGGAVLHVMDCAYRFHAVQDDAFDLGVRALGVKGITARGGRVLLGRRSATVSRYGGLWELAPGGVVEPERDPAEVVAAELVEETGFRPARPPTAVALLFDPVIRCWELVFRIEVAEAPATPPTAEYDELRWCARDALPAALTPTARQMTALL